jgi:Flp pilus assembly protein TadG
MRFPITRIQARMRTSRRGQSLAEMALILPFLLAFAGGAFDLSRAYAAWLTIESATRNAAEYVATNSSAAAAASDARSIVCLESSEVPGFAPGAPPNRNANCTAPVVSVVSFTLSSTQLGATAVNPIGTAHVRTQLVFNTLFPYPLLPEGGWTLSADSTYSVVRGR